jgi:hypothetical protein
MFPHLSQLQEKHRAAGLTVVGVGLEQDTPQTRQFITQQARRHMPQPLSAGGRPLQQDELRVRRRKMYSILRHAHAAERCKCRAPR